MKRATSSAVKHSGSASNPVRLHSSAQKQKPFKFFKAMNGIETFAPPRGGVLATALAIESRSDSEASNKSFGEAKP